MLVNKPCATIQPHQQAIFLEAELDRWRRKSKQFRRDQELLNRLPRLVGKLLSAYSMRHIARREAKRKRILTADFRLSYGQNYAHFRVVIWRRRGIPLVIFPVFVTAQVWRNHGQMLAFSVNQ